MKGDERILGDSNFVETVLKACQDEFDRKYFLKSSRYDFDTVVDRVAKVLGMNRSEVLSSGRQPHRETSFRLGVCAKNQFPYAFTIFLTTCHYKLR